MRTIGRGCAVGLLAWSAQTATLGCGDSCGDVDCGSGVIVWWAPGEVADAPAYRLCVDDACELVEPTTGVGPRMLLSVAPAGATAVSGVAVRLELLDEQGGVTDVLAGGGQKSGGCCAGIELHATEQGTLEPQGMLPD